MEKPHCLGCAVLGSMKPFCEITSIHHFFNQSLCSFFSILLQSAAFLRKKPKHFHSLGIIFKASIALVAIQCVLVQVSVALKAWVQNNLPGSVICINLHE